MEANKKTLQEACRVLNLHIVTNIHFHRNRKPKRSNGNWKVSKGALALIENFRLLNIISVIFSFIVVIALWVLATEIEHHAMLSFYLACTDISGAVTAHIGEGVAGTLMTLESALAYAKKPRIVGVQHRTWAGTMAA